MIPDPQIKRRLSPRLDLIFNEIIPCFFFIFGEIRRMAVATFFLHEILIRPVNRAQVAEVPIESNVVLEGVGCDSRHHDIAAIARVTRNRKRPGLW